MALDRGDGYIVSQPEWAHIARRCGLLSRSGLRLAFDTDCWGYIAAHFGLKYSNQPSPKAQQPKPEPVTPEVLRQARESLNAPLTDDERHACTRRGWAEFAGTGGLHSTW